MKDPCEDCLVSVCCTEICPEKINHNTLCKDALKYYNRNNRSGTNIGAMVQYTKDFRRAIELDQKSFESSNKIITRKTQRGR